MRRAAFLRSARDILGDGAQMIIGVDLEKDERVLYDAYNDAAGVTARFNLNVLVRINRELGGNFDVSGFIHRSIYNRDRHRIEMHLISRKAQSVRVLGRNFSFRPGESIHTENSYKYSLDRFTALARGVGLDGAGSWTDKARMFSGSRAGGLGLKAPVRRSPAFDLSQLVSGVVDLAVGPAVGLRVGDDPAARDRWIGRRQSLRVSKPGVNDPPFVLPAGLEIQERRSGVLEFDRRTSVSPFR